MGGAPRTDVAPGRLAVIQDLANSYDEPRGRDELVDAAAASDWLAKRDLLAADARLSISTADFELLRSLRTAIRGLCLANSGFAGDPESERLLNSVARAAGVHPRLVHHGRAELAVSAAGGLGAIGRLVGIIFEAIWSGAWPRVKACPGDACNYAFYDQTRNNSRQWCSMSRCGSRAKMRAYRARQQAQLTPLRGS
jgi:predicted RNA-binding Zn ribbon-like protein